ncbi:hypothetical protein Gotri_007497 [Gossypium trilobum]|uniref:Retrotransposon gag domain-containing protein n=1 Tax=Gossypium trilobum TaxID=34281 RepID=A0A7J9EGU9_9ROSI|nr:hypothetical protein [Gossypium trilobum]
MGLGKGYLEYWVAVVKPDKILYEMSGIAENIARKAISIAFGGLPTKDPRLHLRPFLVVCDSFRQQGVLEDALRVKLFPYSLRDHSEAWLNTLSSRTVASWNDLFQRFLLRYNIPNMNTKLMNDFTFFRQSKDETLYEAWEVGIGRRVVGTTELDAITSLTAQNAKNAPLGYNQPMRRQNIQQSSVSSSSSIKSLLKQLRINIPPVEALEKIPNYVKLMEDMLSKKRRLGEFETVALTEWCTAMLTNKLPPNLKDLENFTIPYLIGNHYVGNALCDLGASINLIPLSIFWRLGIGKARPTVVMMQLADRSYAYPEEIVVGEEFMRFFHSNYDSDEDSFERRPLCTLLEKNRPFNFNEQCLVAHVYPQGAVDVKDMKTGDPFKVNGQHLEHY